MVNLLAIDQSLVCSGYSFFSDGEFVVAGTIKPKMRGVERLVFIREQVVALVEQRAVDALVIEDYAYGMRGQAIFNLGELGGLLRVLAHDRKLRLFIVNPMTLKKFVLGKANVPKSLMLKGVFKRWNQDFDDDNIADSFALGQFVLMLEKYRAGNIEWMTKTDKEVFKKYEEKH